MAETRLARYRKNVSFHLRRNFGWTNANAKQWAVDNIAYIKTQYDAKLLAYEAAKVIHEKEGNHAKSR